MFERTAEVSVLVSVTVQAGMEEELLAAMQKIIVASREEPGCLHYDVVQSVDEPRHFKFIEKFKDHDAFEFHINQSHIKHFDNIVRPKMVESIVVELFSGIDFALRSHQ
jgi:quinol monooxygenase YgiN